MVPQKNRTVFQYKYAGCLEATQILILIKKSANEKKMSISEKVKEFDKSRDYLIKVDNALAQLKHFRQAYPFHHHPIQTFRHSCGDKPWELDYLFISRQLENKLENCFVLENPDIYALSDHNPIVAQLSI